MGRDSSRSVAGCVTAVVGLVEIARGQGPGQEFRQPGREVIEEGNRRLRVHLELASRVGREEEGARLRDHELEHHPQPVVVDLGPVALVHPAVDADHVLRAFVVVEGVGVGLLDLVDRVDGALRDDFRLDLADRAVHHLAGELGRGFLALLFRRRVGEVAAGGGDDRAVGGGDREAGFDAHVLFDGLRRLPLQLEAVGALGIALGLLRFFLDPHQGRLGAVEAAVLPFLRLAFEDVLYVGDLAGLVGEQLLLHHLQIADAKGLDATVHVHVGGGARIAA